ncbi:class I SAM-dependent methyltransferase [Pseudonocardia ailaonensis]|uniref:class I SAM-dependent methyltransferase n=1 Tax=Pseudonocardia ailaonensis TaxID=367279 RepID=UPI0031E1F055
MVLDAVPVGARTALDVGTGNGLLAVDLRKIVPEVTGIDRDADVLRGARREDPAVHWVQGDVLTQDLAPGSFDVVASVATVHHLPDLAQAFRRFAELTAPGGVVVTIGVARISRPPEALMQVVGAVQHRYLRRRHTFWEHTAPMIWPPAHTYAQVKRVALAELPGARWRLLPMWRYALVWRKHPGPRPQAEPVGD